MDAVYTGRRLARRHCGNDPAGDRTAAALRRPPPPPEEGLVLKEGAKSPKVTGTSYDGAPRSKVAPSYDVPVTFGDLAPSLSTSPSSRGAAAGRRTVLWFYSKANTGG